MTLRLAVLVVGLWVCVPAHAEPRDVGFALQTLVGGTLPLLSAPAAGAAPTGPTVRLGLSAPALLLAATLGYQGLSRPGDPRGGIHVLTTGIDIAPSLWQGPGGRAQLYLLLGGQVGLTLQGPPEGLVPEVSGGFAVGIGGQYVLHPSFALGVEVGTRTQLWRTDGLLGASSGLYGALSGTFVVGS
ncbi:MAG: hypothetical protein NZ890_05195 [Myxococcota bacterium]|nr:hypothetical protein [Myxococcota bacterium]